MTRVADSREGPPTEASDYRFSRLRLGLVLPSLLARARWNDLKFVPERTFADVIRDVTALHGLEDWEPPDTP